MSDSTQSLLFNRAKNMEKVKEQIKALNSSLETSRLELAKYFIEAQCQANFGQKLQKEAEAKAHLEDLEKQVRE